MEDIYDGFNVWPPYAIVMVSSISLLFLLKYIGKRVKPKDNPALDVFVDVMVLIAASSVIAAVSTTPLVSSVVDKADNTLGGTGSVLLGMFLGISLVVCAVLYVKKEAWWLLFLFGFLLQVGAVYIPQINSLLSAWIAGPVNWLWDAVGNVIGFLFGTTIS